MKKTIFIAACILNAASTYANNINIASLEDLTISNLKERSYSSQLLPVKVQNSKPDEVFLSYFSDEEKIYAKAYLPKSKMSKGGYPSIIFTHDWIGKDKAESYAFGTNEKSIETTMIKKYQKMGYLVIVPGYRGHGTLNGEQADGIEYLFAYDNASDLMDSFYAIDVVNLLEGMESLNQVKLPNTASSDKNKRYSNSNNLKIDLNNINLIGIGDGGDVALKVAAIAGEGTTKNEIHAVSIKAGTFMDTDTKLQTYAPMNTTIRAFISGNGTWKKKAKGNKDFVFPYPADYVDGLTKSSDWDWSNYFTDEPVLDIVKTQYEEAYTVYNNYVDDVEDATFKISQDSKGKINVVHDSSVASYIDELSAFNSPKTLTEPIILHFSDRDFYSMADWNYALEEKLEKNGTEVVSMEYTGTNHELKKSKKKWFSPKGTISGFFTSLNVDNVFFKKSKY